MPGYLEVITGGMYCGKSSELIRRLTRAKYAKKRVRLFKPAIDGRYHEENVVAHDQRAHDAVAVETPQEIWLLTHDADIIAIDEAQFFDPDDLISLVELLLDNGHKVIIAGLDMDYTGKPFGAIPHLMAIADEVVKLKAICVRCGAKAYISQRLIDGRPAPVDGPQIQVGGAEAYEARCRDCWNIPM